MTWTDLRVPGALFLALAGLQAGSLLEEPFRRRLQHLRGWEGVLARVASEIRHGGRDLADALQLAGRGAPVGVAGALERFSVEADASLSTASLWARVVAGDPALGPRDREVLGGLGPVLGRYSREEQGRYLESARQELIERADEAEGALRGRGRALRVLMGLGGAALAVLVV